MAETITVYCSECGSSITMLKENYETKKDFFDGIDVNDIYCHFCCERQTACTDKNRTREYLQETIDFAKEALERLKDD